MKSQKIKTYQMLTRVDDFASSRAGLFPKHTAAGDLAAAIGPPVAQLSDFWTPNNRAARRFESVPTHVQRRALH